MKTLRQHRRAQSMTLAGLAQAMTDAGHEISEGQLSRIERGGTNSLETAIKLSEVTGLPVETFAPSNAPTESAAA